MYFNPFRYFLFASTLLTPLLAHAMPAPRVQLSNSVLPFSSDIRVLGEANAQQLFEFQVALKMRDFPDLQARIGQGEIISQDELDAKYYPLPEDYSALVSWLEAQGLTVKQTFSNRLSVVVEGPVGRVGKALEIQLNRVSFGNKEFVAAQTIPTLPTKLSHAVLGVNGLQPYLRFRKHSRGYTPQSPNQPFKTPYAINDILTAYNAKDLGVNGENQKIAILIDTVPLDSDLQTFWKVNKIPQSLSRIEKVNVTGGTLPAPTGEETLDTQWTSGIAPSSSIRIYATKDLSYTNLDKGFQAIINDLPTQPTLRQLSISLGACEARVSSSQLQTTNQFLTTIASRGVSIFVSSGDYAANCHPHSLILSPLFPASSPSVTAVGGTNLKMSSGTVVSETAWSITGNLQAGISGSGGGVSGVFARPKWQQGTGVLDGTTRLIPDVAAVGDPYTGVYVVLNGKVYQVGGTSVSAPIWAGLNALMNQARVNAGKAPLGLLGPRIYPLIGSENFRDIMIGSNGYPATTGYDLVTGMGVPVTSTLLKTLVNQPDVTRRSLAKPNRSNLPQFGEFGLLERLTDRMHPTSH